MTHSRVEKYSSMVHVAAAAVFDGQGRVMITRRHDHLHQGGLWEFPGGKLEAGEGVYQALCRELHEEVGIDIVSARPLIRIPYHYPDKAVLLDVWRVDDFRGQAHGREGQPLEWVFPDTLREFAFPAANGPIVDAVRLPERYLITPEPGDDAALFLDNLSNALEKNIRLVQLRAKSLPMDDYLRLAEKVRDVCHEQAAQLLLNAEPSLAVELGADGVHLSSERLSNLSARPIGENFWLAASCHSLEEIHQAAKIKVDFAVLGSVKPTKSHPAGKTMGWEVFRELVDQAGFPVYALGGMCEADLGDAYRCGGQGIAAISALWPEAD